MAASGASPLANCVSSLQSSLSLLNSSISILDASVGDFPRLGKVVKTQRHFELVTESALVSAQSSLLASLTPEVNTLLSRVESYLDRLARMEMSLIAKAEVQEGRLQAVEEAREGREAKSRPLSRKSVYGDAGADEEMGPKEIERMRKLKDRKERLKFAIERLNLRAGQAERNLRKSMAAPRE